MSKHTETRISLFDCALAMFGRVQMISIFDRVAVSRALAQKGHLAIELHDEPIFLQFKET
jgi:hypothetical protein